MFTEDNGPSIADRQDRLKGYSTDVFNQKTVFEIGGGGLGSTFATGLVRKGIGRLIVVDDDRVEVSTLHRTIFREEDLFQPKALRLARALSREGFLGTEIIGHETAFDETTADLLVGDDIDLAIIGVDNDATRVFASRYFRNRGIPCLHAAVNLDATYGWCFLEQPGDACLACVFPDIIAADGQPRPCIAVPAVLNILMAITGPVLQAVDSVLMERPRGWNFHSIHLTGTVPGIMQQVPPLPGCPLCGAV